MLSMERHGVFLINFIIKNPSLYRESGDKAARIFRFKPTDCEFI